MQEASRVPVAETKRPWWYVTDQERMKKLIDEHSKVLVRVEVAVTGLQRRLSMIQTRCDSLEMTCQGVVQQNETLTGTQQRMTAGCDSLKGGLEAVTDRVVAVASGVDAVAGCVLELEGRLQRLRLDNVSGNLGKSSWMKELGERFEELSALHASHDIDTLGGKLTDAKFEKSLEESSARTATPTQSWRTSTPQPSAATSLEECSYSDSPPSSASSEIHDAVTDAVTEPAIEDQQSSSTVAGEGADLQATKLGLDTRDTSTYHRDCEQAGKKLGRPLVRVMPPPTGTARSRATEQRLQEDEERHLPGVRPPRLAGTSSLPLLCPPMAFLPPMAPSLPPCSP